MDSASALFDVYSSSVIEVASDLGRVVVVPNGAEPLGEGFVAVRSPFEEDGGYVITAWNPQSKGGLSLHQNRARNLELRRRLVAAGARVMDAVGRSRSGDVAEESFYCTDVLPSAVLDLAEYYEQNAVFHIDAVRLVVVGVLIDEQRSSGYSVWARE
ncbi:MAG: DUF3293 domain-containing protein [Ramlibacter sp.]|nr:DUF3293 domain-containing protein [Cryobacterium sp.]